MRCSTTDAASLVRLHHNIDALALWLIFVAVFSAPKYCDSTENRGAYINIGPDYKLQFEQFDAVPHPDIKPMASPLPPKPLPQTLLTFIFRHMRRALSCRL